MTSAYGKRESAVPYIVLFMLVRANLIQAVVVRKRDAEIRDLEAKVAVLEV